MVLEGVTAFWNFIVKQESIWWQIAIAGLIFLFALAMKGLFTRFLFIIISRLTQKTKTDFNRATLEAFEGPIKNFIIALGVYFALNYLPLPPVVMVFVTNLFRSAVIIFIARGFYNLMGGEAYDRVSGKLNFDQSLSIFTSKALRVVIIALAIVIVVQEWNYDISGLVAGLGLGGLAISLAARDAVANVIGGVIIILDKPFTIGDWIQTSSVEGTVEEMSLRSTRVRTFANALVAIPNAVVSNEAITNWTRTQKRRISFHLGVTYTTPRQKLQTCVNRIKDLLENHPEVHPDLIMVRFEQFAESSLDIFIYFFTKTKVWPDFLAIREEINFKIMEILEEEGVSIAFPSRSIYFENKLETETDRTENNR